MTTTHQWRFPALEVCLKNRLLTINDQIRSTRKRKAPIVDLVASRKETDRLLAKVRRAQTEHPCDQELYNTLWTEYKNQVLI